MKFNKWTLGLAAIGVVSLASATQAKADEAAAPTYLESTLKGISISGNIDTSLEWAMHPGTERSANSSPIGAIPFRGTTVVNPDTGQVTQQSTKQDGFNLNVIELTIEKALDEAPAASGFKMQLLFGPDAVGFNPSANGAGGQLGQQASQADGNDAGFYDGFWSSDFAIKQAYVAVRAPVGNGIDFKMGVFDTIIGYEVFESANNPNFSRSWGYALEPTQHTGLLASYKISDMLSVSLGVANTLMAGVNARNNSEGSNADVNGDFGGYDSYWCKSTMASITFTAPENWGFMAGSAFYSGYVYGFNGADDQVNFYAGSVINTPVAGLTTGIAYDYVDGTVSTPGADAQTHNLGLYTSYKITEKLSVHGRYEYGFTTGDTSSDSCYWGLTGTVQYDLWANVISRLEIRHEENSLFAEDCGTALYLNMVYKF